MAELKALIFDVDGTLADTERDGHRVAFNRAFAAAELDWHWSVALYGQLLEVGGGKERIDFYLNQYQPQFHPPSGRDAFIAELHQAKTQHYQELLAEGAMPLRPGVKRLLTEARSQGLRLAIATTGTLSNVTALLKHHLDPYAPYWFEIIAAGDIVRHKKPAPDIYHYVLQKMGLAASDCVVFEDSSQGLQAALGACLKTVITVNDYTRKQDLSGAMLVVDCLGDYYFPFCAIAGEALEIVKESYLDLALVRRLHHY